MPFASSKTPEQLAAEKKAKMVKLPSNAIKFLERLSRMRGLDANIKNNLNNEIIPSLKSMVEFLSK